MLKRIALNGLAVAGLALGTTVSAQESTGLYLGASLGEASVEIADADFDGSDTAFKVFGGYAFNDNFAVELAWFDGGNADEDYGAGSIDVELTGLNASVIGRLPVGEKFALFGRLGFTSYDAEVSARVNGETVAFEDGSDEDLSYGVGGELTFGQQFGFRAEYEIVDASDAEFNFLSIGGVFHF